MLSLVNNTEAQQDKIETKLTISNKIKTLKPYNIVK